MKRMISARIEESLLNRLRNAIYWTPGATLEGELERALEMYMDSLEKINGPFPQRKDPYGK